MTREHRLRPARQIQCPLTRHQPPTTVIQPRRQVTHQINDTTIRVTTRLVVRGRQRPIRLHRIIHRRAQIRLRIPNVIVPRVFIVLEGRRHDLHQTLRGVTVLRVNVPHVDSPRITRRLLVHATQHRISQRHIKPLSLQHPLNQRSPLLHTSTNRPVISTISRPPRHLRHDKFPRLRRERVESSLRILTDNPRRGRNLLLDRVDDLVPDLLHLVTHKINSALEDTEDTTLTATGQRIMRRDVDVVAVLVHRPGTIEPESIADVHTRYRYCR